MLSHDCQQELQSIWLPNITDAGLQRLSELLEKGSPLLVHGCFTRTIPMGCLATHIAWNHPQTCHLTLDAGITWLHRVAGLNPATSEVLRAWDVQGIHDLELRLVLLREIRIEQENRQQPKAGERRSRQLVAQV